MLFSIAERKGFEPLKRFRRLHTFQACAFDHSAISPSLFFERVKIVKIGLVKIEKNIVVKFSFEKVFLCEVLFFNHCFYRI